MSYDFKNIELKWQKFWSENEVFKAENKTQLKKYYIMDMFPYPSGAGLHVGHPLGYIASDIFSRYKRQKGFNVLHPQGYDSFGLPAEQYAIKTGRHPAKTTAENIDRYRQQLDRLGLSFDWSREIRTSNKDYYKWTQWMFIKFFNSWYDTKENKTKEISELIKILNEFGNEHLDAACNEKTPIFSAEDWLNFSDNEKNKILLNYRIAYLSEVDVNWCPKLGTVLANDEVINGFSERGGYEVIKRQMTQWSLRISPYAERLLDGLDRIDWPDPLKEMQRNWIGKSVGLVVEFDVKNYDFTIETFTTRPDTIFGVTFLTLAPEHHLTKLITQPKFKKSVLDYIESSRKKTERERISDTKTISGVFTGSFAMHPVSGEELPIWISDYVLSGYGTGAVMAVPCGDQRDHDFAKHFNLPIKNIFKEIEVSTQAFQDKSGFTLKESYELNGLEYKMAFQKSIEILEKIGKGIKKTNYKLRDAVFSRQRYWGEPFPVYYKDGLPHIIDEKFLPLELPKVNNYLPTEEGYPPLGNSDFWSWDTSLNKVVSNDKIDHKTVFPLELNTMPGWAGSSWYFNRYMDPKNEKHFASAEALKYWKEIDLYVGGSEHATGHLLYSRFWQYFLFDHGLVPVSDYAKKLINQGMILGNSAFIHRKKNSNTYISAGLAKKYQTHRVHVDISFVHSNDELNLERLKSEDTNFKDSEFITENSNFFVEREVEKMSKSKYNVVNPDFICDKYGADTLRLYEMFLGPIEHSKPWNMAGISGTFSFLKKFWNLYHEEGEFKVLNQKPTDLQQKILHKTIKKVSEDMESFSFNTSVSAFMICVNELISCNCNSKQILTDLCVLLSPFAPHICEEIWFKLGNEKSISAQPYPNFNPKFLIVTDYDYPVSFNGKMKFKLKLKTGIEADDIKNIVINDEKTIKTLNGRKIKKVIVVPKKIINIVC